MRLQTDILPRLVRHIISAQDSGEDNASLCQSARQEVDVLPKESDGLYTPLSPCHHSSDLHIKNRM